MHPSRYFLAALPGGFLVAGVLFAVSSLSVQAMDSLSSTEIMLKKMAVSARTLSYIGTATYEQSGVMRSVKIVHTVRDGREVERLEYLDGPRHEIIRQGNPVDCERVSDLLIKGEVLPGARQASLQGREQDDKLNHQQGHGHLEDYYHYSIRGDNRVAGREVVQVFLKPRDRYRYGHLLSLDKKTGLLLQSMLINMKGNIMERFQFTDIDIGVVIDESALQPKMDQHIVARTGTSPCGTAPQIQNQQFVENRRDEGIESGTVLPEHDKVNEPKETEENPWQAAWLPPGFVLSDLLIDTERHAQEMMYTDGMSAFSIFIDPDETLQHNNIEARRGATVAYLARSMKGEKRYIICVVGELPMHTARLVAEAVVFYESKGETNHGESAYGNIAQ